MAKQKKQKQPAQYIQAVHVPLPFCGQIAQVRQLQLPEVELLLSRSGPDVAEAFAEAATSTVDMAQLVHIAPALWEFSQRLAAEACIEPVFAFGNEAGKLDVRALHPFDVQAILIAAQSDIRQQAAEVDQRRAQYAPALQPIPPEFSHLNLEELPGMDDPEIRRKTIENCYVSKRVIDFAETNSSVQRGA